MDLVVVGALAASSHRQAPSTYIAYSNNQSWIDFVRSQRMCQVRHNETDKEYSADSNWHVPHVAHRIEID
jgi:hypothetical protein